MYSKDTKSCKEIKVVHSDKQKTNSRVSLGLDIGSTTVKVLLLTQNEEILYSKYQRHFSDVRTTIGELLKGALESLKNEDSIDLKNQTFCLTTSGSGAITLSSEFGIDFVQEVIACAECIRYTIPDVDVAIELGGEDAKITFFTGGIEQRMNETCAGGTGAFIDQMATFLNTDASGLNELALNYTTLYPIASRCGVFAKTDILPLLNEGCRKEDIAASIFQAVVEQTIGGLACGREIKGKVIFLGGPLAFLSALRQRFFETLKLAPENAIFPPRAEYFVAQGAIIHTMNEEKTKEIRLWTADDLYNLSKNLTETQAAGKSILLRPLFKNDEELSDFRKRHNSNVAKYISFEELVEENPNCANIPTYLGIDIGSTTIKSVLIDEKGRILSSSYQASQGEPLNAAVDILKNIYEQLPKEVCIGASGVTGYGSALIQAALHADVDEVETLAHCKAARFFRPNVSFILDIGGQDIKCLHVKNNIVHKIQLNEACSAGCGSFIETFAKSLGMDMPTFVQEAISSQKPVDLGSRCTVFMNSKVKQVQKEGAQVGDIAAGLSYSVIKNALYKVIKISSPEELGEDVIAQGGAFYNDALLRSLELSIGRDVVRMDISGLMGAFGMALLTKERHDISQKSSTLSLEDLENFQAKTKITRCQACSNHCLLTVTKFQNGSIFTSGNRCERGAQKKASNHELPNLFNYKYQRLFEYYTPLEKKEAVHGTIGIPRVLNIYENYPLWFTLFTELGYRVELSDVSSKEVYTLGISTIPSQTVCYPAKLAHGHIINLIEKGITRIFYPCLPFEQKDFQSQDNSYNCPVVSGYPELLKNNLDQLHAPNIQYFCPFLPLTEKSLKESLMEIELFKPFTEKDLILVIKVAFAEQEKYRKDVHRAGTEALEFLEKNNLQGVILTGHPYHVDPEVHHGIPDLINSTGLAVLSEDSVAHLMPNPGKLRFTDQWTYHARIYRAAAFVAQQKNLALIQLISFGCGLDAISADQTEEILSQTDQLYTQIKIDEGANLGAARIRVRSLLATIRERQGYYHNNNETEDVENAKEKNLLPSYSIQAVENTEILPISKTLFEGTELFKKLPQLPSFTEEMRETHTILIPQMSPLHFQFFPSALRAAGYKCELLPSVNHDALEMGLRHVNNDACFPAIMVIGQLLHATKSDKYDINKIALILSQTGGGCRATNYIGFMKKAMFDAKVDHVPLLSLNMQGLDNNPGFKVNFALMRKLMLACLFGDVLMRMLYRVRPYEKVPGSANALVEKWSKILDPILATGSFRKAYKMLTPFIHDFDTLELLDIPRKPRVGLVGEILIKFHPDANNSAVSVVEGEGGEAVMPDLLDFFLYSLHDPVYKAVHLGASKKDAIVSRLITYFILTTRLPIRRALKKSTRFSAPLPFRKLRKKVSGIISLGHQTGEGWLLTAEMIELIEQGAPNILCMQPFGCLPNHITGKGMLKKIKELHPEANIVAVDYDPGASEVNQINRIKLMMAMAKKTI